MMSDLSFIHRFEQGTRRDLAPLLLLHGTGGDEDDLIPLGRLVAPHCTLLSMRGQVLEGGAPLLLRVLAEGQFDKPDAVPRARRLAHFNEAAGKEYGIAEPI